MSVLRLLHRSPTSRLRRTSPFGELLTMADYRDVMRRPAKTPGEARVKGTPTRYSDRDGLLHSIQEIYADEVYRFEAKSDAPHVIDAGANIGLGVRYFKQLYPRATVVAYEPDPAIFGMLRSNVGGMPGVELREAAAWVEDAVLTFHTEGSLAGSTEVDFAALGRPIQVRAERLKDEIAKRPVDFLKIDIEGAESAVLFDIADELDAVDHLFFEYHSVPGKPQSLGALLELVAGKGFRYGVNGAHGPRWPFVERVDSGFDLQLNVFCFRP